MRSLRTRTRSGCLPCRSRRRKCDERRPQCQSCKTRGYICQWGLKASFHPSRSLRLSSPDRATLLAIEKQRENSDQPRSSPDRPASTIIDDTQDVIRCYHISHGDSSSTGSEADRDENETPGLYTALRRTDNVLSSVDSSPSEHVQSNTAFNRTLDIDATIDSLLSPAQMGNTSAINEISGLSQHDQLPAEQFEASPSSYILPFSLGKAVSRNASPLPEPSIPVSTVECARLVSSYLCEAGTWCETTDSERHFTSTSIHQLLASNSFLASAIALASRQRDAVQNQQRSVTLELYQYTIQLLLRQDPNEAGEAVLATCTLLCVYEMMASCVWEWRRHLKGCAGLLHNRKWNGSSSGIVKSCFWAFARIDVWAAFISGKKSLIPTGSWVDDSSIQSVSGKGNIDDYCNLAILIFARIVNLLADAKFYEKEVDPLFISSALRLWNELQEWWRLRPKEVHPLLRAEATGLNAFPTVILSGSSAICGSTFYHSGSILLLQTGCIGTGVTAPGPEKNPLWHARELGGISASNVSHANWVNQLQPLYIAGTVIAGQICMPAYGTFQRSRQAALMGGDDTEEYASEKIALLKQLARIERETGWKTSDRASELRDLWGF